MSVVRRTIVVRVVVPKERGELHSHRWDHFSRLDYDSKQKLRELDGKLIKVNAIEKRISLPSWNISQNRSTLESLTIILDGKMWPTYFFDFFDTFEDRL